MNVQERIYYLLDRYTLDQCSDAEKEELEMYMNSNQYDAIFEKHIEMNLHASSVPAESIAADRSEVVMQRLRNKINQPVKHRISFKRRAIRFAAAAIIIVLVAAGVFIVYNPSAAGQKYPVSLLGNKSRQVVNNGTQPMQVLLEDGSEVMLQPAASLTYPLHFEDKKREVLLKGNAFFHITKNPEKHFFVYHGNLITEVLGTSFTIDLSGKTQHVEVIQGKVQVYENKAFAKAGTKQDTGNGVIITSNQKVEYTEEQGTFNTAVVKIPLPVTNDTEGKGETVAADFFNIKTGSLLDITRKLQDTYGIKIMLEDPGLNDCLFSGDISNQNLFEKLDILCKAMGISYAVNGTTILLKGEGCN